MPENEVIHLLTKEYSITLATNQEDFQAVKDIRHDVIINHYPEIKETKEYIFNQDDEQSFIYLLQHKETKTYAGSVRIFFANEHTPIQKIPMEKDFHVKNIRHLTQNLPICEISRFALSKNQIKHKGFSELRLRTYLSLALMIATRINAFLYCYSTLFSIMEPSLKRLLKGQNANFEQIGEPMVYHGIRIPFAIRREKLLQETEENVGQITRYYLKELCKNPESFWKFIDSNPYLERSDIQLDRICQLFEEYGDDVELSLLMGEKEVNIEA